MEKMDRRATTSRTPVATEKEVPPGSATRKVLNDVNEVIKVMNSCAIRLNVRIDELEHFMDSDSKENHDAASVEKEKGQNSSMPACIEDLIQISDKFECILERIIKLV